MAHFLARARELAQVEARLDTGSALGGARLATLPRPGDRGRLRRHGDRVEPHRRRGVFAREASAKLKFRWELRTKLETAPAERPAR